MSLHRRITTEGLYFITFTCYEWIPFFRIVNGYDLVYKWFDILTCNGHAITGYIIMPNHIHLILHFKPGHQPLNTIIGNGKRFMAYDIVKRLEQQKQYRLLKRLEQAVTRTDRLRGKKHEIWKDAFDAKECRTEPFVLQKLNYIHNNPCSGKWKLAASVIDYPHSSARFYICNKQGVYEVRDYREFLKFE